MGPDHDKQTKRRTRRRAAAAVMAVALSVVSCGRSDEGPLSPNSPPNAPPRPSTAAGLELIHAHYHLPARPAPPRPGMM